MSIFTRDKIWFSADKRTYWEARPGNQDARLIVNDTAVITISTTGCTIPDLTITDDFTVGDDLTVTGDAAVTGNLTLTGTLTAGANGLILGVSTGVASLSTLSFEVVSLLTATGAAPTYVLPTPTAAGQLKILVAVEADSTHKVDFTGADLVNGFSTANYIGLVAGGPSACVGLLSLSTDAWQVLWPAFSTAAVVVSTVSS